MMIVFFDIKGIVHREFFPKGQTVNAEFYCSVLRRLREDNRRKRPSLWRDGNWVLYHDNAPAHNAFRTRDFLVQTGTTVAPHPPYSPDLAPCDFFLFPKLKMRLKGRHFNTVEEIQCESQVVLNILKENDFQGAFQALQNRWTCCIDSQGDYVEDINEYEVSFSKESKETSPPAPNDKHYLVFIIFLLHGIGVLLPWNVFITANRYFVDYKLNTTTSYDAEYKNNFLVYIGMGSQIPNLLLCAFNAFFQSGGNSSTQGVRFIVAVLLEIFVLVLTIVLAILDTSDWPGTFFALTIVSVIFLNSCTGIYQSFVFGLAALLPMRYSNAVVIGNNLCGTIVAICSIVTEAAAELGSGSDDDGSSIRTGAIYYFVFAVIILLLCFDTYFVLPHLRFYRFYTKISDKSEEASPLEVMKFDPEEEKEDDVEIAKTSSTMDVLRSCCSLCCFCPCSKGVSRCRQYWGKYVEALRHCWVHCLSVFSVFFCTLSVFPELMSKVKPSTDGFMGKWFTGITCFLFFNLFALIGNLISNVVQRPGPKWLWLVVWVRTFFFIPFFMFCNVNPGDRVLPVLFHNEWIYIIGVIVMALSSGYLSSLCMMYAPSSAPEDLRSIAGMLAAFCLVLGVSSGVQTSLFWSKIVVGLFAS